MSYGSIYKIPFPNGKYYIGLTSRSLEQRTKEHRTCAKSGSNKYLYNAIRKHDMVDTFKLVEIDNADTIEELCEKEIQYVQEYNSYYMNGNGYNMTLGGEGFNGYIRTEADKQKMSESRKTYFREIPGAIERNREAVKQAHINNPELRNIQSTTRKKNYQENPQVRENLSNAQKIRMENPEVRERLAEQAIKFWNGNDEAKKRMSELKKEQCNDLEWKKKQSEILLNMNKNNPELGKQHGEKMKQMHIDNPELGKQHGEKLKKMHDDNPELAIEYGKRLKQAYINNPELRIKIGEAQKKRFGRQSERDKLSKIHKKRMENPEARQQASERSKKQFENPEARQQLSKIGKELWKTPEHRIKLLNSRGKNKPFDMFKKDGTFVKTFTYQFEAIEYLQKEHHITSTINISEVLSGNRNSSAGFKFKYK